MNAASYANLCRALMKAKLAYKNLIKVPNPFRINVAATYLCNLHCKICNIWKTYEETPSLLRDEMSAADYAPLFESLAKDLFWLGVTGGEPFLKKDLVDIVHLARSKMQRLHILELTTNGFSVEAIEKKLSEILKDTKIPFITVGVSLDGPPSTHNHVRGQRIAWQQAIKTYKRLLEIAQSYPNLSPHMSYTFSRYNAGNLLDFLNALAKEGIKTETDSISVSIEHSGHLYQNVNRRKNPLLHSANADMQLLLSRLGFFRSVTKGIVEIGKQLFKRMFLMSAIDFLREPSKMVIPCAALFCSCFIDPFGVVYPCSIYGEKLGSVRNTDFDHIWHSYTATKLRENIRKGKCVNCWSPCEAEPSFLLSLPKTLIPALVGHVSYRETNTS